MNKLKQVVRVDKLSDIWEKEIDSKLDLNWGITDEWVMSEIFFLSENIMSKCLERFYNVE
jgi:hypothetical protein